MHDRFLGKTSKGVPGNYKNKGVSLSIEGVRQAVGAPYVSDIDTIF
jgi:hypothetical protein